MKLGKFKIDGTIRRNVGGNRKEVTQNELLDIDNCFVNLDTYAIAINGCSDISIWDQDGDNYGIIEYAGEMDEDGMVEVHVEMEKTTCTDNETIENYMKQFEEDFPELN